MNFKSFLLVFCLLSIGTLIYIFFYPSSIFLNQHIQPFFEELLVMELPIESKCKYIFNIPTAIWSFCFIFSLLLISYDFDWLLYLAICAIIVPELMQHNKLDFVVGTFDINDLIMNFFGIFLAIYFVRKYYQEPDK